jgi:acetyltransferase
MEVTARLLIVAADEKVAALTANIMPDNRDMLRVFEKLGFSLTHSMDDELVRAEFKL